MSDNNWYAGTNSIQSPHIKQRGGFFCVFPDENRVILSSSGFSCTGEEVVCEVRESLLHEGLDLSCDPIEWVDQVDMGKRAPADENVCKAGFKEQVVHLGF